MTKPRRQRPVECWTSTHPRRRRTHSLTHQNVWPWDWWGLRIGHVRKRKNETKTTPWLNGHKKLKRKRKRTRSPVRICLESLQRSCRAESDRGHWWGSGPSLVTSTITMIKLWHRTSRRKNQSRLLQNRFSNAIILWLPYVSIQGMFTWLSHAYAGCKDPIHKWAPLGVKNGSLQSYVHILFSSVIKPQPRMELPRLWVYHQSRKSLQMGVWSEFLGSSSFEMFWMQSATFCNHETHCIKYNRYIKI